MIIKHIYKVIFSTLLLVFYLLISSCLGANTLAANVHLTGDQTLISSDEQFELGFFQPGKISNYYIGIWYKKIPGQVAIWVANRDKPVTDKYTSKLRISNDGNLVLVSNESNSPIWSTNISSNSSKSMKAVLLDNGNLVLREDSSATSVLWESFDHPTDTLIAGGKLGLNKVKKMKQSLTSWKNSEDPGTGLFTIEHDSSASQFIMLWNNLEKYWSSGLWIPSQKIFSLVPELSFVDTHTKGFVYVNNQNESYVSFSLSNPSIPIRHVMHFSGQVVVLLWQESSQDWILFWSQPGQPCDVYSYCGAFATCNQLSQPYCHCLQGFKPNSAAEWNLNDYSGGCARNTKLSCEGGKDGDAFIASPGTILPENAYSNLASTVGDCKSACLRNCTCSAYAFDENGCSIWFSELHYMKQISADSGRTLYVRVSASDVHGRRNMKLILGVSVSLGMGLVGLFAFVFVYLRRKRRLHIVPEALPNLLTRFGLRDLQSATKNFSHKLGGGGFGSVYKGIFPDSTEIAVKKLESINNNQGEKQFKTEVSAIGTIQHMNLVRLHGFCSERSERLLVYEYVPNGSLNTHLFRTENSQILSWELRYHIAMGIARGLAYLHEGCRDCIIHCDIKPENILLDDEFRPKVADFGLAKLVGREFSRVLTTMRGTRGYLAPEWISGVAISTKADVYSYGMILFELISGRRNFQHDEQASNESLDYFPIRAMSKITEGEDVLSIVDPELEGNAEKDQVMRLCKLACWCIQDEENGRPSMGQVVQILEGLLDIGIPPIPRSLQVLVDNQSVKFYSTFASSQHLTEKSVDALM